MEVLKPFLSGPRTTKKEATWKNKTSSSLAKSFATEFATRFDMEELIASPWHESTRGKSSPAQSILTTTPVKLRPRGMMAFMVKTLEVTVEIYHNNGEVHADVELRYGHHNGGSNGYSGSYMILYKDVILQEEMEYNGFISHEHLWEINRFMRERQKTERMKPTKKIARKVLEIVDQGLVKGLGKPIPGQMCVEAAVCYAMGVPHDDSPSCVDHDVRWAKIALNDQNWPSKKARAQGLRRLAIAQLGSDQLPEGLFREELRFTLYTKHILPSFLETEDLAERNRAMFKQLVEAKTPSQFKAIAGEFFHDWGLFDRKINAGKLSLNPHNLFTFVSGNLSQCAVDHFQLMGHGKVKSFLLTADLLEEVLKKCKSPGVKWLDLSPKTSPQ